MSCRHLGILLAPALVLLTTTSAGAARITVNDDAFMEVRVLAQPTLQVIEDGSPAGDGPGTELFLRRLRLVFSGNVSKNLSFFVDTDSPNLGKGPNGFDGSMYIQDAVLTYKLLPELIIDAGLIIIPLTHHSIQGATSLHTLDYHAFLIKYPKGSHKVWRDTGLQLRGMLAGDRLHYRVGVFSGVRGATGRTDSAGRPLNDLNPDSLPRVAGQLRFNLFDPEPDLFFGGIYLGKKRVVSIGVGADYQPDALDVGTGVRGSFALGGDVFVDYPTGDDQELVAQANVVAYRQGRASPATGLGYFVEAGYRYRCLGPVVSLQRFDSDTGAGDLQAYHLGLNYWLEGHTANVKASLGLVRDAALQGVSSLEETTQQATLTVQTQLFF